MSTAPPTGRPFRLGAVVAIAIAAGFVVWLVLRNGSDNNSSTATATATKTQRAAAQAVTRKGLRSLAASVEHPVFWLGPKSGYRYELTRTTNGKIYVRYLPRGVAVGADKPYLTVATYPFPGAFAAIKKQAAAKGAATVKLAHGGIAVLDQAYPKSVHLAYPGVNYQVEVYDPMPARAMQLVSAGQVANVGGLALVPVIAGAPPAAATVAQLGALATSLGHPIYWAGPKAGYTYELTETSTGKVYIRYLPKGVPVGDPRARYLTVATYPFPGAFAAVKKTAGGAATIKLARGGIGVVDGAYPKSIHVAFPGLSYQVEVFDPSPSSGRRLVASGVIAPVP